MVLRHLLLVACAASAARKHRKRRNAAEASAVVYADGRQPRFHIRPARGWLNDPNGPVHHDGTYHVFFQKNADESSPQWGNIVWGHATSTDLAHWKLEESVLTRPPAYEAGGAWSGSVTKIGGRLTLIYTCTNGRLGNAQCVAFPDDDSLATWTRSASNPVMPFPPAGVNAGLWRDPTEALQWHTSQFVFVGANRRQRGLVLAYHADSAESYELAPAPLWSTPLIKGCRAWRDGDRCAAIMIECPDLIPLREDGELKLYALKLSIGASVRRDYYLVGTLRSANATPVFEPRADLKARPRCGGVFPLDVPGLAQLDCGVAYASKSFDDASGRRLNLAWLPDFGGPATPRSLPYNGSLTLPREVSWSSTHGVLTPFAPELEKLRDGVPRGASSAGPLLFEGDNMADAAELRLRIAQNPGTTIELRRRDSVLRARLKCSAEGFCSMSVASSAARDSQTRELRKSHALCTMEAAFTPGEHVSVVVYIDHSLIEWDLGAGRSACAHRWYDAAPASSRLDVSVASFTTVTKLLEAWKMLPAYH